jgi:hypothetical protein
MVVVGVEVGYLTGESRIHEHASTAVGVHFLQFVNHLMMI